MQRSVPSRFLSSAPPPNPTFADPPSFLAFTPGDDAHAYDYATPLPPPPRRYPSRLESLPYFPRSRHALIRSPDRRPIASPSSPITRNSDAPYYADDGPFTLQQFYPFPPTPPHSHSSQASTTPSLSAPSVTMPLFKRGPAKPSATSAAPSSTSGEDRCFCGAPAEEDSIYCSVACGRKDALNALCGEDDGDGRAKSETQAGSHYRRVELAEAQKLKERTLDSEREKDKAARMGAWRFHSTNAEAGPGPASLAASPTISLSTKSSSRRLRPAASRVLPPSPPPSSRGHSRATSRSHNPRSASNASRSTQNTHSSVPSLSSSATSDATGESELSPLPSPSYPRFPSTPTQSPRYQFDEASPQPTLCARISTEEIYASYLDASPSFGFATPHASPISHPFPVSKSLDFTRMSLGERSRPGSEESNLAYLGGSATDEEERDRVDSSSDGWGGEQLKERVRGRMPSRRGHQKGKLSFEDVLTLMRP